MFKNIATQPVPCLFRGFSAPVKYQYVYSDEQLLDIMSFASDEFSRWDAGQTLFNKYLVNNVKALQQSIRQRSSLVRETPDTNRLASCIVMKRSCHKWYQAFNTKLQMVIGFCLERTPFSVGI